MQPRTYRTKRSKKGTLVLWSKPKEPKRKRELRSTNYLDGGETLESLLDWAQEQGFQASDVMLVKEWERYDDYERVELQGYRQESDEEFEARLKLYQRERENWERWYQENQEEIEAILAHRREKKQQAKEKALRAQAKTAEQHARRLRKQLEKLEKN